MRSTAFVDETGNRHGRLTVVERADSGHRINGGAHWTCQCDCGKTTIVSGRALRSGATYSCGCANRETLTRRYIDLTGQRFGRLFVVEWASISQSITGRSQGAQWLCKCDCGSTTVVQSKSLRTGATKSCGCLVRMKLANYARKPFGVSAQNNAIRSVFGSAALRKIPCSLTREQVIVLIEQPCTYCGSLSSNESKSTNPARNGSYRYNGIDRMDNSLGYTPENCVPCCKHCNIAKRDRTFLEFKMWIAQVYSHLRLG